MPRAALPALVAGCVPPGTGAANPAGDRAAYLAALESGDVGHCAAIADPDLRGECVALGIGEHAHRRGVASARAACAALPAGGWRDECFFQLSDATRASGADALALCDEAGRFWQQCVGHAIDREAEAVLAALPPGAEDRAVPAVAAIVARYTSGGEVGRKARRIVTAWLANRHPDAPFSLADCGSAPRELCRDAYVERVRVATVKRPGHPRPREGEEPWRIACGARVTPERAAAAGLPTWTPDVDDVVAEAWRALCRR